MGGSRQSLKGIADRVTAMIVVRIIMNVLPEKQKEVMQTLLSMIEPPEKENGCLSYGIFCDIEDQNVFNLISEWKTRQDLDHHMKSDQIQCFARDKEPLIRTIENSNFYGR